MDNSKRIELIKKVRRSLDPEKDSRVLVSLEDFFVGNDDYGSIGRNLNDHPGPQGFYDQLKHIRSQSDVQDVLVEVSEADEEDTIWPFSERVYIFTSVLKETVQEWMEPLQPDELEQGYAWGTPAGAPQLRSGIKIYGAWWD